MTASILVVEDHEDMANLIGAHVRQLGCAVRIVHDGLAGLREAESGQYDLMIVNWILPQLDGLELCRRVRSWREYLPILMLTARSSALYRVLGLDMGADDLLLKPFSLPELGARVRAILRRSRAAESSSSAIPMRVARVGEIELDPARRCTRLAGRAVELTAREFDLLAFFMTQPGRVFTREKLLSAVWGYGHSGYDHTVNSHINRLRAKIEPNPKKPSYLVTVWGVGYRLTDVCETAAAL